MTLTRKRSAIIVAALLGLAAVLGVMLSRGSGTNANPAANGANPALPPSGISAQRDVPYVEEYAKGDDGRSVLEGPASTGSGDVGAPAPDSAQLDNILDRKIVQSTSVDLGVEEVGRSFQEIIRLATTAGGFVAGSSFSNFDDRQVADLTVRVPNDQYQSVLAKVRGLGDVNTEASDATDVTEQYTDYQARLRTLEATEQRYLELLAQAETIDEILTVQDRLDGVRGQIEQLQGQINLLEHTTDLATITVHLQPIGVAAGTPNGNIHPLNAAENAWEHSLDALRGLAAAALVVAVFSWWLLPPLAAAAFAARWWAARRPQPRGEPIA